MSYERNITEHMGYNSYQHENIIAYKLVKLNENDLVETIKV